MPSSSKPPRPGASGDILSLAAAGLGPVRPERFAERVYETLFHAIVEGRIAVGSKLPSENDLATLFEVSRPVVRQALDFAQWSAAKSTVPYSTFEPQRENVF